VAPHPSITVGDRPAPAVRRHLPIAVVLDRLRSAYNVGNIFRLAEALRIGMLVTGGYTASPPHDKLEKTARGCDRTVPTRHAEDTAAALAELDSRGYAVWGVETVGEAVDVWDMKCTFPVAFVLGNEALGLAPEVVGRCQHFVRLPMYGRKNSINVGNAAAVVLYEAARQAVAKEPQSWTDR
jgi:tRNA G18 (ribose-2'-O)-methylase SpoU